MTNPVDEYISYIKLHECEKEKVAQTNVRGLSRLSEFAARNPLVTTLAATALTPLAAMAAQEAYRDIKGAISKARGFRRMMQHNPALDKEPADKVKSLYNTLHNSAPTLANDPVIASSWIKRTIGMDEYIDPRSLADLGAAEQRIARPGLEFPISAMTSATSSAVSGLGGQQMKAEELALKQDLGQVDKDLKNANLALAKEKLRDAQEKRLALQSFTSTM